MGLVAGGGPTKNFSTRRGCACCKVVVLHQCSGREEDLRQSVNPSSKPLQPKTVAVLSQKTSRLRSLQDPDARMKGARQRLSRLEQALTAMGDTEGREVDGLRSALERAKEQWKEVPVDIQVKEGELFLMRARAHLPEINKVRATTESVIVATEARLERLKVVSEPVQDPVPPPEWAAEVQRLRKELGRVRAVRTPVSTCPPAQSSGGYQSFAGEGSKTSSWSCGGDSNQTTRCGCQTNMWSSSVQLSLGTKSQFGLSRIGSSEGLCSFTVCHAR